MTGIEADGPGGLWKKVREIPSGRVASYGDIGLALEQPVSGLLVGRWIRNSPQDVPWWRVVGKNGDLLIARLDPNAGRIQEERLSAEGVEFIDGRVDMDRFSYPA